MEIKDVDNDLKLDHIESIISPENGIGNLAVWGTYQLPNGRTQTTETDSTEESRKIASTFIRLVQAMTATDQIVMAKVGDVYLEQFEKPRCTFWLIPMRQ